MPLYVTITNEGTAKEPDYALELETGKAYDFNPELKVKIERTRLGGPSVIEALSPSKEMHSDLLDLVHAAYTLGRAFQRKYPNAK